MASYWGAGIAATGGILALATLYCIIDLGWSVNLGTYMWGIVLGILIGVGLAYEGSGHQPG